MLIWLHRPSRAANAGPPCAEANMLKMCSPREFLLGLDGASEHNRIRPERNMGNRQSSQRLTDCSDSSSIDRARRADGWQEKVGKNTLLCFKRSMLRQVGHATAQDSQADDFGRPDRGHTRPEFPGDRGLSGERTPRAHGNQRFGQAHTDRAVDRGAILAALPATIDRPALAPRAALPAYTWI